MSVGIISAFIFNVCKSFPCSGSGHPFVFFIPDVSSTMSWRWRKSIDCIRSVRKLVLSVLIVSDLVVSEAVSAKHSLVLPSASCIEFTISWISFKWNISGCRLWNGVWFHIFCGRFFSSFDPNCTVRTRHYVFIYIFFSHFAAKKRPRPTQWRHEICLHQLQSCSANFPCNDFACEWTSEPIHSIQFDSINVSLYSVRIVSSAASEM